MSFLSRLPTSLYLTFFIVLAWLQIYLLRDTVMGDTFIHFVFARGIAEGTPFFYNGDFSAGSTSPLWSLLLTPLVTTLNNSNLIVGTKIFAGFFVATTVFLTYVVAEKITKSRALALTASGLFATSFVLSFWAAKGMETPLAVTLVLGTFLAYLRIVERPAKHFDWHGVGHEMWLGILLGLTILARPEGWILAAILGGTLVWRKHFRVIATVGIPALLIIAPYYALVFAHTGQIFPSSMARVLHARQFVHETFSIFWTTEIVKILATKLLPLTLPFGYFVWRYAKANDDGIASTGDTGTLAQLSRAFAATLGLTRPRERSVVFVPIFLWLVFHLIFFTFVMPMTQGYRYLLPALPFFYTLALIGVWRLQNRRAFATALVTIILSSLAISGWQLTRQVQAIATCEAPAIDHVRRETGEWLRNNTQPTDVIAIKEVDQSAYYSGRRVLSMDGTLNLAAVPFVERHDQLGYLKKFQPEWLVLEEDMYALYPDWQRSNLTPLADHALAVGESKTLDGVTFTLVHKIRLGDATTCENFKGEYFWDFYRVSY